TRAARSGRPFARAGARQTAADGPRAASGHGDERVTGRADVIVIGGGIVGTSTAFFLRQRNRSVILLERGLTGQQASGVNFGGVRRQGRALEQLAMSNRALETWRRSRELLGEDVEFLPSGHTRVCYHAHDAEYFHRYAADARA